MRIWIVNYHTDPPGGRISNPRYLKFAKHFMLNGWEVTTFNAVKENVFFDQFPKEKSVFFRRKYEEYDFVHVKSPNYEGNGLNRMFSIWMFAWRLYCHCKQFEKPDVVLHNIHTPFDYPIVWMAKKLKAKYVAEAWDLWPDDFVTFGLVSSKNPFMKFFYWVEKKLYYNADQIVFTFEGAFDYLRRKGWLKANGGEIDPARLHYINNGIDLDEFDRNELSFRRFDSDMNDPNLVKIVYLGTIKLVNNVKLLIETAVLMQGYPQYKFFIYGDGDYRAVLEQYVKDNHIKNVVFKEKRIEFEECAWVVSQATVNVMNYEKGFGRWGVSSGKLFQYLAAGKPIVCNINIGYDNVIKDNNLGIAKNIETPEDFAAAIRKLAEQPKEEYDAMCERVRETAKRFDYKVLAEEELKVIESACGIH